jgi:hypothetical protein
MVKYILSLIVIILLTILLGYSIITYWSLPEVHFTSGGECIRVINHSGSKYDCENMPNKYINYIIKL